MPLYAVLSFVAASCFAVSGIIEKFASKHAITNRWQLLFWYYVTFIPFVLIIPFISHIVFPESAQVWLYIALYSMLFLLGNICFFTAIFQTDASVFSPLFQLQAAFLAVLSYLFLGERFAGHNYFWMVLMLAGAMLVSMDELFTVRTFFRRSILLVIAMQILHAGSNMFAGFLLRSIDFWNVMWWTTIVSTLLVFPFTFFANKLQVKVSWRQLRPMVLTNAVTFIGAAALFRAFAENVTLTAAISLLSGPITFIITLVASKVKPELLEHHTGLVYGIRGVGIILTVAGAYFISTA